MSTIIHENLEAESQAILAEAKALDAERPALDSLAETVANTKFALSESEIALESDPELRGIKCSSADAFRALPEPSQRLAARKLMPVLNAASAHRKAVEAYDKAASPFVARQKALVDRMEAHIRAQQRYAEVIQNGEVSQMDKTVNEVAGLISFGLATNGMDDAESWEFCKALIDDYRKAKDYPNKRREFKNFYSAFKALAGGKSKRELDPEAADLVAQFEALKGEDASAFYAKHKDVLVKHINTPANA